MVFAVLLAAVYGLLAGVINSYTLALPYLRPNLRCHPDISTSYQVEAYRLAWARLKKVTVAHTTVSRFTERIRISLRWKQQGEYSEILERSASVLNLIPDHKPAFLDVAVARCTSLLGLLMLHLIFRGLEEACTASFLL